MSAAAGRVDTRAYEVGQLVGAVAARYEAKKTQPPQPYDMATLLDDMLSADKFATSPQDREVLRQIKGLGTARTRAPIVDGLVRRGLLETHRRGKRHLVRASEAARMMASLLPAAVCDVTTTAKWELAFSMIERGDVTWRQVVDKQYAFVRAVVALAKQQFDAGVGGLPSRDAKWSKR